MSATAARQSASRGSPSCALMSPRRAALGSLAWKSTTCGCDGAVVCFGIGFGFAGRVAWAGTGVIAANGGSGAMTGSARTGRGDGWAATGSVVPQESRSVSG